MKTIHTLLIPCIPYIEHPAAPETPIDCVLSKCSICKNKILTSPKGIEFMLTSEPTSKVSLACFPCINQALEYVAR